MLPLGFDPDLAKRIYLIWMIPNRLLTKAWYRPLNISVKGLDELIEKGFI